jgi:hypothetical protein
MPTFCSACNIQTNSRPDPVTRIKIFVETEICSGCNKEYCKNGICNKQLKEFGYSKFCNCLIMNDLNIYTLGTCDICNLPYTETTICNCKLKCTGRSCPNNHEKLDDPNKKH